MIARITLLALLALVLVAPSARGADSDKEQPAKLAHVSELLGARRTEEALKVTEEIVRHYEDEYSGKPTKVYCSRSEAETLVYMLMAAKDGTDAVAIGVTWSDACYLRAYALIELGRTSEARTSLTEALKLAPFNAQYLSEMAHLFQIERKWSESQELFVRAEECANAYSPEASKVRELTRALRGQGYNLVELGRLDEAEAIYKKCLDVDRNDKAARAELAFVAEQKRKAKAK